MTVFRAFLKVLKSCRGTILLYTVILIFFAGFNARSGDHSMNFTAEKPDILIVNRDENIGITKNLIEYLQKNTNSVDIKIVEDEINDALFYRKVNYVVYIPEHFREDFLNHKMPSIEVKNTGDYMGSLAEMMLGRYLKLANVYSLIYEQEDEIIGNLNRTLSMVAEVEITSKLDTDQLTAIAGYYNFLNYSLLAGCVYVVCLILYSFKKDTIRKRTVISSMNFKTYNRQLLLSNSLFVFVLWFFYVLLSFLLFGSSMLTSHGIFYIANSFIFSFCSLSIAFLIGNLIHNKEAINGLVNVIALGSSFLCGAFVPPEYLPTFVLKIAHLLPSYWYIHTNEILKTLENFELDSFLPILLNWAVLILFILLFIIFTNVVSSRRRKLQS